MESWVLVTGAGTGIGRGIVLALARERRRIVLVGRRRELLEKTANEARELGATCWVIDRDLAGPAAIDELVAEVHQHCGIVSALINNAGVLMPGPLSSYSMAEIERAVSVNLLAPLQLTRAFSDDLKQTGGSVVLVASTAAWLPFPETSLYVGTKAGLRAWGESMRWELEANGVKLLIAYPPFTETSMTNGMAEGAGVSLRLASPLDVGQRIVNAMNSGRRELWYAWSDWLLSRLQRWVPWLVRWVMKLQRERLCRMMATARERQKP